MKIYAVVFSVPSNSSMARVIRYFSQDKKKCENFIEKLESKFFVNNIEELESETELKCFSQINW